MEAGEAIGRLLEPGGTADPYPIYAALRTHGPVARLDDRLFVASGYSVITELLRDPRMRVQDVDYVRRVVPGWEPGEAERALMATVLQVNPPDHTRLRRVVAGAFTPRRIAQMRGAVQAQAEKLTNYLAHLLAGAGSVDFMADFAFPLPVRVICALLGVPVSEQTWFREQATALTAILEYRFSESELDSANRAATELTAYFDDLVKRRRAQPTDDLTSALIAAGEQYSQTELLATLILLLVAGFETTTNLLGNGLVVLLDRPEAADALRADDSLAERYVEELLRFDAPVQVTSRWCREAVTVAGTRIPADAEVMLLLGAGNRDPERFEDADAFDPLREPFQPLSFGAGAHYCLGAALARMEAQLAFPLLLNRFPTLRLADGAQRRDRLTLRGYTSLPVALA
jgi:cytochrome P450